MMIRVVNHRTDWWMLFLHGALRPLFLLCSVRVQTTFVPHVVRNHCGCQCRAVTIGVHFLPGFQSRKSSFFNHRRKESRYACARTVVWQICCSVFLIPTFIHQFCLNLSCSVGTPAKPSSALFASLCFGSLQGRPRRAPCSQSS